MIKSLFEHDDEQPQPKENKPETETEESIRQQLDELNLLAETPGADDEVETVILPRIEQVYANANEPPGNVFPENRFYEADTETPALETAPMPPEAAPTPQIPTATQYRNVLQDELAPRNESVSQAENVYQSENAAQTEARSLTTAETIRQSGMAWSAAIGLFGSVLFMMILGWFFDLLTGASPLGLVGGIIVGSAIGFYQFFRTTSQIFKKD
ncbi:MAG TPA: AtpZ/AtpI family protein [Pyrinomonadaceae bacterium]